MISRVDTMVRARTGAGGGRILLALTVVQGLTLATGTLAQEVCKPQVHAGAYVWYAVETQPRASTVSDSGCTAAGGVDASVRFMMEGSREIIFCDLDLRVPDAMRTELKETERQVATELPSRRKGRAGTWGALVRKYSRELACTPGFERTSDGTSEVPSVWCQRRMTARELCPRAGSTFTDGACSSMACPDGTVDLELSSRGKLAGCSRCPAGRIDLEESIAWQDQSPRSSTSRAPATTILCRARSSDPCPGSEPSAGRPSSPAARAGPVHTGQGR